MLTALGRGVIRRRAALVFRLGLRRRGRRLRFSLPLLGGQILQVEFSVRAEDQARIEVGESDLADAQLKRLQIELQSRRAPAIST